MILYSKVILTFSSFHKPFRVNYSFYNFKNCLIFMAEKLF